MLLTDDQLAAMEKAAPLLVSAYRELRGHLGRAGRELETLKAERDHARLNLAAANLEVKRLLEADKCNTESLIRLIKADKARESQLTTARASRDEALKQLRNVTAETHRLREEVSRLSAEVERTASV